MREYITLIEMAAMVPKFVYHGTSYEQWSKSGNGDLYVTVNPDVAKEYAKEWEDEGETPVVFQIELRQITSMVSLEPNWETVDQIEHGAWAGFDKPVDNITWQDTMNINGTFIIANFSEKYKQFCKAIES